MTKRVTSSSVPVRASGEPQKEQSHCENCGAPGVELQELMCRSCWEQEAESPRFHWRDGVYFQRVDQGAVLMTLPQSWHVIPRDEWASILTHLSAAASPSDDGARQPQGSAGGARGEADARECDAGTPQSTGVLAPPAYAVDLAVEVSGWSPCRSKRGVVIFSDGNVVSHGYNYKPRGFDCDGSAECKATCRREAVHAEQQALMSAGNRAHASEMLHVKTVDGKLVPSGGPSCVECSKLAWAARIAWVWLYHDTGWRRYTGREFHELSLRAAASDDGAAPKLNRKDT